MAMCLPLPWFQKKTDAIKIPAHITSREEEEEEGPFNVLSVNVQHLLGRTVFFICDAYVALFLRPDALPDTNTRAVLHE
jgi:hypothetical protein